MMRQKRQAALLLAMLLLVSTAGCASPAAEGSEVSSAASEAVVGEVSTPQDVEDAVATLEATETVEDAEETFMLEEGNGSDLAVIPLAAAPAISTVLMPQASGVTVLGNEKAQIDASNTADGYVMIRYLEPTSSRIKVVITGPSGVPYYYNLTNSGAYEVFPLSDGNGSYNIQVCKNVQGTSYSISASAKTNVQLKDQFAPFLLPNQYVNYTAGSNTVKKAAELSVGCATELDKIRSIYNYVVQNISYDKALAQSVQSGYLPVLDNVLASKKGICFDYAALMTAMLRSQGVPCKLVVGNAGTAYHAWINAWSASEGWMDAVIYFDGMNWKLMDPTFASGSSSEAIAQYIGDGSNYQARYLY